MTEDEASVTNSETLTDFEIDSSDLLRALVSIRAEDKDVIRLSMISTCKIYLLAVTRADFVLSQSASLFISGRLTNHTT